MQNKNLELRTKDYKLQKEALEKDYQNLLDNSDAFTNTSFTSTHSGATTSRDGSKTYKLDKALYQIYDIQGETISQH
jgi:hypothetical protein